ncbi:unnamed protein product [Cuscuta campestris]|uniref:Uncharacterized protein n=1 Tax=Cuscuta campestris TaxID=132261 RepID=A0A484LT02_9ASTE|nr:unnamed protein product [Cuscuta campestris]
MLLPCCSASRPCYLTFDCCAMKGRMAMFDDDWRWRRKKKTVENCDGFFSAMPGGKRREETGESKNN